MELAATSPDKNGLSSTECLEPVDLQSDDEGETQCGWGPIRGPLLQKLANKKAYLLVYGFLGLFQSMFFSYSIATLTTLEKQFKLNSKTTGILLSGNECSQIMLSLVLTYFGDQGHRPRLVSLGIVCSGVASLLIVIPHFVYGKSTIISNSTRDLDICDVSSDLTNNASNEDCSEYNQTIGPMVYIFMSQFISGIGTTLFGTLGITYLDDNTKRKSTPMLIGIISSLRLVGPAIGYALAGICIRQYVNLTENTTLKPRDPSWIGAWWLGFMVIGIAQLMTFWILALFPKRLPKPAASKSGTVLSARVSSKKKGRTLKEFPAALRRLLTNKIVILNNLSAVFYILALSGYITFLPKYIETQFEQPASKAGLVNGGISILFTCTGLLFSGFVISRFRPRAWQLLAWDVGVGVLFIAGLVTFAFIGCDSKSIHGINKLKPAEKFEMFSECNIYCNCMPNRFTPVCSEDGSVNFFSACHAGCKTKNRTKEGTVYSDCSCINGGPLSINSTFLDDSVAAKQIWESGTAMEGYCQSNCFQVFLTYVLVIGVIKFLSSAGRVSGVIIGFRCVDEEDKSFAIGLGYLFISLFAFIPSPIVYGAIIDKACKIWRTECSKQGNCWFYDPDKMREYLHFTTAGFIAVGVIFDIFASYAVRNLELYEEPEEMEERAQSKVKNSYINGDVSEMTSKE